MRTPSHSGPRIRMVVSCLTPEFIPTAEIEAAAAMLADAIGYELTQRVGCSGNASQIPIDRIACTAHDSGTSVDDKHEGV